MIRSDVAARIPHLGHAHSERADGPVGAASLPGHEAGRSALVRAAGGDPASLVVPHQVHAARIAVVGAEDRGRVVPATDGLATAAWDVPLLVQGADCPLVLLAARTTPVAVVVHSGWRGTVARIVAAAVRTAGDLGAPPADLVAAVFPGIGPCCFEVGPEVVVAFRDAFGAAAEPWSRRGAGDRSFLDLAASIRATLVDAGVEPSRIDVLRGCTVCDGRFFSHRGSRGAPARHGLCAVLRR